MKALIHTMSSLAVLSLLSISVVTAQGIPGKPIPPSQGVIPIPVCPDPIPWFICPSPGWGIAGPILFASGNLDPQRRLEETRRLWEQAGGPLLPGNQDIPPLTSSEHILMGNTAMAEARFAGAAQHFSKAVLQEPLDPDPALRKAIAQLALGQPKGAAESLQRAFRLMPQGGLVRIPVRQLYAAQSASYERHLRELEAVMKKSPEDEGLLLLRTYLHWCDGQQAAARKLLQRAKHLAFDPSLLARFSAP
jgi:tetratricopeptide (TPR) repeat protein